MTHKYSSGQNVYYEPTFGNAASRGKYKIVRPLPVENDNRLAYRIKSIAEILRAHRRGTSARPGPTEAAAPLRSAAGRLISAISGSKQRLSPLFQPSVMRPWELWRRTYVSPAKPYEPFPGRPDEDEGA